MKFPYISVPEIRPDLEGFYRIGHDAYHSGYGISSTKVKRALQSYAAFAHEGQLDSPALAFGRAFHAAILEPHDYRTSYAIQPEFAGHPNSNAYKADRDAWRQKNVGKIVIEKEDAETIEAMIVAVKSHPDYASLPAADPEIMAITTCKETGLKIKCKSDLFGSNIVDFKTTSATGIQPSELLHEIAKYRYHVSAAFYQDIIFMLTGERFPFIVVPVTKNAPFECEFYQLSDELLEEGRRLYKAGLRRIAKWAALDPMKRYTAEKRTRILYPSQRIVYSTKETIDFIEGK